MIVEEQGIDFWTRVQIPSGPLEIPDFQDFFVYLLPESNQINVRVYLSYILTKNTEEGNFCMYSMNKICMGDYPLQVLFFIGLNLFLYIWSLVIK